jgi:uncharacterized membrane protein YfcA
MQVGEQEIIMSDWFYVLLGFYLIVTGLTARSLINEAEMPATEKERQDAKPTWLGRTLIVAVGIAGCLYGILGLLHWR